MIKIYLFKSKLSESKNNIYEITNNLEESDFIFLSYQIKSKQTNIKYVKTKKLVMVKVEQE